MTRKALTKSVLQALFAKSGNRCAYPGCENVLVNGKNIFVGQVAHISAVSPNGPRFDAALNDDQRRSYENLLLTCYEHHREIDLSAEYSSEVLREIKIKHETLMKSKIYSVDENIIDSITDELNNYWDGILNISQSRADDIQAVRVDIAGGPLEILNDLKNAIQHIADFHKEIDRRICELPGELVRWRWELSGLAMANWIIHLQLTALKLRVKLLEEIQLKDPENDVISVELGKARGEFMGAIKEWSLHD
jgi:hypothetical protein